MEGILSDLGAFFSHMTFVDIFNVSVLVAFTVCYFYQLVYVFVSLARTPHVAPAKKNHHYAVLISARNEEAVIADLLNSLVSQDYPQELLDVYVIADNCNDSTADAARACGVHVLERQNKKKVGKGYALNWGLHRIWESFDSTAQEEGRKPDYMKGVEKCPYEAYFVFDADNVLSSDYIKEMNKTFDSGAKASTSYRNSKNFAANWISAGYGIWFLREAKFLSQSRFLLNTSCTISGTGFFISSELLRDARGWKWHLLTEDIEFSADEITRGVRISYCPSAMLFDEQPEDFRTSWNQRYRWAKGFYQVFAHYGARLVKGIFTNPKGHKWACYDMLMTIAPGMLLTVIVVIFNAIIVALCATGVMSAGNAMASSISSIAFCLVNYCSFMGILGVLTVFVEWHKIRAKSWQKVLYCVTFPLFMLSYIPIALCALFGKAHWKPIPHKVHMDVNEVSPVQKSVPAHDTVSAPASDSVPALSHTHDVDDKAGR